jgi:hypothetical protein
VQCTEYVYVSFVNSRKNYFKWRKHRL